MTLVQKFVLPAKAAVVATALLTAAVPGIANAQDATVVARVGDREITKDDLAQATQRLGQQFAQVPASQRQARILDALIDFTVLAQAAEKEGVDKEPDVKRMMEYLRLQALHNAYFTFKIRPSITDEMLKQRYEKDLQGVEPQKEVKARHILVKTEEEAKGIIEELKGGADFIELAKAKSTGPSGPQGGDLGFFGRGRMVPEFDKAAFEMKPGEFSQEPVKTQFGFHVLKVDEIRDVTPPTFEQSKDSIRQALLGEAYQKAIKDGRAELKVEVLDDSLKAPAQ